MTGLFSKLRAAAELGQQAAAAATNLGTQAAAKAADLGSQAASKATQIGQQAAAAATELGQQAAAKVGDLSQQASAKIEDIGQTAFHGIDDVAKPETLIADTFKYSDAIKNGRTKTDIYAHAVSEMEELRAEIAADLTGNRGGDDGIVGESIDVILCLLDLIHVANPEMTPEQITKYAKIKLDKWATVYANNPNRV